MWIEKNERILSVPKGNSSWLYLWLYVSNPLFRDAGTIARLRENVAAEGVNYRFAGAICDSPELAAPFENELKRAPDHVRHSFDYHDLMRAIERAKKARETNR